MNKIIELIIGILFVGLIISGSIYFVVAEEDKEFEDSLLLTIDNDYEFSIWSFALNFGNQMEVEWRANDTTWGWIAAGGDVSKEVPLDTEGRLTLTASDNAGLILVQVADTPVDNTTVVLLKYAYNWNGDARLADDSIFSDTNTFTDTISKTSGSDEEAEEGDPLAGLIIVAFIGIGAYYIYKKNKAKTTKIKESKIEEPKISHKSLYCISCGTSLTPGSEFCTNCGTKAD
ncbi:MAG: hypothetical protein HeimC2_21630 [Candidatus Heimdallarchaeota archaeon LC_2]|nr:MAG: hypothetical protein HeimC2_21630 [Candidatus Heimdallarchaeota archaeon LC_2]